MSGHRQAALALYALSPPDQHAILAELPGPDQAQLRGYLAELAELGFDDVASGPAPAPARLFSLAPRAPATPAEQLRRAQAAAVAAVLADEPAGLVARVLAGDTWPWHDDFMAMLEPGRRAQVQRALEMGCGQDAAPACVAMLIEAIVVRLVDPAAPAPRSRMAKLFNRASAWTR